jgi:hypothetical protein
MKKSLLGILVFLLLSDCRSIPDYLIKFYAAEVDEMGAPFGYLNARGDTIILPGTYDYGYMDTIRNFGMVIEKGTGRILGIDRHGSVLYEVFKYDNGPDPVESGLFSILENGKIGYADETGKVVIPARFDCAYPFEGSFARVADDCDEINDGEHRIWESDHWYQITDDGKRVP